MPKPFFFETQQGRKIAYHYSEGRNPMVVFLGGFMSDMEGTKATYLEQWAKSRGQAFLRFDYFGHGQSDGAFSDGTIGQWLTDALAIISEKQNGAVVLVGSSMGGWISLRLAQRHNLPIKAIIGIAAAPDFTEDSMWAEMDNRQRDELQSNGIVYLPSDYGEPYPITRNLIEDGRNHLVLRSPLDLPFPVRLLHGSADKDVSTARPMAIMDHAKCDDLHVHFVKGADHSFSSPRDLELITQTIESIVNVL